MPPVGAKHGRRMQHSPLLCARATDKHGFVAHGEGTSYLKFFFGISHSGKVTLQYEL